MCISFAKQCGEAPVKPFRLEPAPARSESKIHFPFARLAAALTPLRGLEPAPARCKSSSKLGSYSLTRSLNPFGLESASTRWHEFPSFLVPLTPFTPTCELFSTEC